MLCLTLTFCIPTKLLMKVFCRNYFLDNSLRVGVTSCILVATGPQYPTDFLTQLFWMAVAPPIVVANNNLAQIEKP